MLSLHSFGTNLAEAGKVLENNAIANFCTKDELIAFLIERSIDTSKHMCFEIQDGTIVETIALPDVLSLRVLNTPLSAYLNEQRYRVLNNYEASVKVYDNFVVGLENKSDLANSGTELEKLAGRVNETRKAFLRGYNISILRRYIDAHAMLQDKSTRQVNDLAEAQQLLKAYYDSNAKEHTDLVSDEYVIFKSLYLSSDGTTISSNLGALAKKWLININTQTFFEHYFLEELQESLSMQDGEEVFLCDAENDLVTFSNRKTFTFLFDVFKSMLVEDYRVFKQNKLSILDHSRTLFRFIDAIEFISGDMTSSTRVPFASLAELNDFYKSLYRFSFIHEDGLYDKSRIRIVLSNDVGLKIVLTPYINISVDSKDFNPNKEDIASYLARIYTKENLERLYQLPFDIKIDHLIWEDLHHGSRSIAPVDDHSKNTYLQKH